MHCGMHNKGYNNQWKRGEGKCPRVCQQEEGSVSCPAKCSPVSWIKWTVETWHFLQKRGSESHDRGKVQHGRLERDRCAYFIVCPKRAHCEGHVCTKVGRGQGAATLVPERSVLTNSVKALRQACPWPCQRTPRIPVWLEKKEGQRNPTESCQLCGGHCLDGVLKDIE